MKIDISDTICITLDVDWVQPEVLSDAVNMLDAAGIRATVFCTHAGITVPGHERALHPNFRLNGDSVKKLIQERSAAFERLDETERYRFVVGLTKTYCPEAVGVRGHSLFYDSLLLPVYHEAGIQYESSYLLQLAEGLRPVWKEYDILEIPIYFNDHFELKSGATGFRIENLRLDRPGLKVFQFHPQMLYINAETNEQYLASKQHYHDAAKLLGLRSAGRGVRTLFIELLEHIANRKVTTATLAEVDSAWRRSHPQATPEP